ncbi:MAG: choice-of-anchor D domain-containing protein, partial [Planktomarina sp.]
MLNSICRAVFAIPAAGNWLAKPLQRIAGVVVLLMMYLATCLLRPLRSFAYIALGVMALGAGSSAHAQATCANQTWGDGIGFAFHRSNEAVGTCGSGGGSPNNGINMFLDPGICTNDPSTNGGLLLSAQDGGTGEFATSMNCTGAGCAGITGNHFFFSSAGPANVEAIFNVNGDSTPIKFSATLNRSATAPFHCSWSGAQIEGGNFGGTSPTVLTQTIDIQGNGTSIPAGSLANAAFHTHFGNADITGGQETRTYTIRNTGTAVLQVSAIEFANPTTEFSFVGTPAPANIAAGASTTFSVQFDPTATGSQTANVIVRSNARNSSAYSFLIRGIGTNPEIGISSSEGGGVADGGTDAQGSEPAGTAKTVTYTITNTGTTALTLTGSATASGLTNITGPVSISAYGSSTVAASGGTTTFTATYTPTAPGPFSFDLDILSDDFDEATYDIAVSGTAVLLPAEIAIIGNGNNIVDGTTTTSATNDTDFGQVSAASGTITKTFTITNSGTGPLTLGTPTFSGPDAFWFTVGTPPTSPVAPSGTTSFTVIWDPSDSGTDNAVISIPNNDADESPFTFALSGFGLRYWNNAAINVTHVTDGVCGAGPFANATSAAVAYSISGTFEGGAGITTLRPRYWNGSAGNYSSTGAAINSGPIGVTQTGSGTHSYDTNDLVGTTAYIAVNGAVSSTPGYTVNNAP